jgi:hypothetical protein
MAFFYVVQDLEDLSKKTEYQLEARMIIEIWPTEKEAYAYIGLIRKID